MRVDKFLLEKEKTEKKKKFYRNKSPFDMLRGEKNTMGFFPYIYRGKRRENSVS